MDINDPVVKAIWKRLAELAEQSIVRQVVETQGGDTETCYLDGDKFVQLLKDESRPGIPHTCKKCGRKGWRIPGVLETEPDELCARCRRKELQVEFTAPPPLQFEKIRPARPMTPPPFPEELELVDAAGRRIEAYHLFCREPGYRGMYGTVRRYCDEARWVILDPIPELTVKGPVPSSFNSEEDLVAWVSDAMLRFKPRKVTDEKAGL